MRSTSRGPITDFLKQAGFVTDSVVHGARLAGKGMAQIGKGVWSAAGHLAPNPLARTGLLGVTALGVGTQVPQLAGRVAQGAQFVRSEVPSPPRGF